jgi:PTH1 family peptidyl-tRNA hydrolase
VSGQAVQRTQAFYKIEPKETIVVHDEIDLPFGKIRVKVAGGHGGHNGLRSIIQMTSDAFVRVRCGLGKPVGGKEKVTGHVLGGFSKAEQTELPFLIGGAADAVQLVLDKGPTAAMNKVNAD